MGKSHYGAARSYFKAGDRQKARREFARALRLAPLFPRTYVGLVLLLLDAVRKPRASRPA